MHRLKFYGCSDDTFGEYGVTGDDVDNCGSCEPVQCVIDCGEQGRLMVIGQYSKASLGNGCWMAQTTPTTLLTSATPRTHTETC